MIDLTVTDQPASADLAAIGNNLAAFNAGDVGPSERRDVVVTARNGETLVAGLSGY
ncbi:GNAT family N-acetyltransferase, partial [Escherichia coli]|nr:GNAT family N-acetyltransferase [Escherichia coli]